MVENRVPGYSVKSYSKPASKYNVRSSSWCRGYNECVKCSAQETGCGVPWLVTLCRVTAVPLVVEVETLS